MKPLFCEVEEEVNSHICWSGEPNCFDWNHYSLAPLMGAAREFEDSHAY